MRSLGTRRVALFAGAATVTVVALAGCSAGQVASTATDMSAIQGVNAQSKSGSVLIRNLVVKYNGIAGYQPGANAPIWVNLYNQTTSQITVLVGSAAPTSTDAPSAGVVTAQQIGLLGGTPTASATPSESSSASASPTPSTPPTPDVQPARITIAPLGSVSFLPGDTQTLEAVGLSDTLMPGNQLSLVFRFSDGSPDLGVLAPVETPLSPAPRASGVPGENVEG
ncbi:MAG TPA: hypothetical protein VGP57_10935 [Actinoplanes sp.]|jgi:hypothetical protein|nr:hypothetical protein [Actinoplanes sp.]